MIKLLNKTRQKSRNLKLVKFKIYLNYTAALFLCYLKQIKLNATKWSHIKLVLAYTYQYLLFDLGLMETM